MYVRASLRRNRADEAAVGERATHAEVRHDLAIDAGGGRPSPVDAGLSDPPHTSFVPDEDTQRLWAWAVAIGWVT